MSASVLSEGLVPARQRIYPSIGQVVVRLALAVLVWLTLDAAFWFSADFESFIPASSGPFAERLYFTGLTAAGPFAMVINGHTSNLGPSLLVTCGLCAGLVAVGVRWRQRFVARLVSYLGVSLWFFFGFVVAGIRIT